MAKIVPDSLAVPLKTSLIAKRIFDVIFTIPGIIILLPVYLAVIIWVKLDSSGSVLFRQLRVGKDGQTFCIYKFRTMSERTVKTDQDCLVEGYGRVTRCGRILRKYKLDELPQLFNVLKGEMSLVGPRPMVPKLVAKYPPAIKEIVLSVPPGITDFASITYINEDEVLKTVENPEEHYRDQILPSKLSYYVHYVQTHNVWLDFKIILLTLVMLLHFPFGKTWKNKHHFMKVKLQ